MQLNRMAPRENVVLIGQCYVSFEWNQITFLTTYVTTLESINWFALPFLAPWGFIQLNCLCLVTSPVSHRSRDNHGNHLKVRRCSKRKTITAIETVTPTSYWYSLDIPRQSHTLYESLRSYGCFKNENAMVLATRGVADRNNVTFRFGDPPFLYRLFVKISVNLFPLKIYSSFSIWPKPLISGDI